MQVKANQKNALADIKDSSSILEPSDKFAEEEIGRGRIGRRKCMVINDLGVMEKNTE